MSVDKFGRVLPGIGGGAKSDILRGPKGEGFVLDKNGDFIVVNKKIKELADPVDNQDAVNKRWIEGRLKPIEDKLTTFQQGREIEIELLRTARETAEKAFDKASTVQRTLQGLSSRIVVVEQKTL